MNSYESLVARMNSGEFKPKDWNWVVQEHAIKRGGSWVSRTCIFVMAEGGEQCEAIIPLIGPNMRAEAIEIVTKQFGVDQVL